MHTGTYEYCSICGVFACTSAQLTLQYESIGNSVADINHPSTATAIILYEIIVLKEGITQKANRD